MSECRLSAGFLQNRVHHRCHDPGGHVLQGRATRFRELRKPLPRTEKLMLEDGLGVAVECAVAPAHLTTTAARGAASAARVGLRTGAVKVKPQNMRAIPISSPR
jgi:hypothetical protein